MVDEAHDTEVHDTEKSDTDVPSAAATPAGGAQDKAADAAVPSSGGQDQPVPEGSVVVGVTTATVDDTTLRVAAGSARRLRAPLHIVSVLDLATQAMGAGEAGVGVLVSVLEEQVNETLDAGRQTVAEIAGDLPVTVSSPVGGAQAALVAASQQARLVVVGAGQAVTRAVSDTEPPPPGLSATALAVAMHASCPVLVVRGPGTPEGPVVVGVDGSEHSKLALAAAARSAANRGTSLRVLATWWLEVEGGIVVTEPGTPRWDAVVQRVTDMAQRSIETVQAELPDLQIELVVEREQPHRALVEASAEASALVVGSRGRGGFRGMLLGSVSQRVLKAAACPVLVVRRNAYEGQST